MDDFLKDFLDDFPLLACLDCQVVPVEEHYMLYDALWLGINPKDEGVLCIGCAERRLGRQLKPTDFTGWPY